MTEETRRSEDADFAYLGRRVTGRGSGEVGLSPAEDHFRLGRAALQAVIESLPFDLFALDSRDRYVMQNAACREHGGDVIGKTPEEVAPDPETLALWRSNNARALAGDTVREEVSFSTGGQRRHYYNIISPIRESGRVVGILGVNIDITAQKQLEEELRHAQRAETIGTLVGGIAHDFNNLLQSISGFAELLCMSTDDEELRQDSLSRILDAAERGGTLTRQILAIGRKLPTSLRAVDLNAELQQLIGLLERTIPASITIELDLSERPAVVHIDPGQVQQVLLNLALNARDAMPEGGRLIFRTEHLRGPGVGSPDSDEDLVRLRVSDTGHGMAEEVVERIFEPFFTTKGPGEGSGLGLSVVHGIVTAHGGSIACASRPSEGTTFTVLLPALDRVADGAERTRPVDLPGGDETILVVDDDEAVRAFCERLLGDFGYNVITAANGEAGLERYRDQSDEIDLVIVDLLIPHASGIPFCEAIREVAPGARIVVAGGDLSCCQTASPETRPCAVLNKPFSAEKLLTTLRRVLDRT